MSLEKKKKVINIAGLPIEETTCAEEEKLHMKYVDREMQKENIPQNNIQGPNNQSSADDPVHIFEKDNGTTIVKEKIRASDLESSESCSKNKTLSFEEITYGEDEENWLVGYTIVETADSETQMENLRDEKLEIYDQAVKSSHLPIKTITENTLLRCINLNKTNTPVTYGRKKKKDLPVNMSLENDCGENFARYAKKNCSSISVAEENTNNMEKILAQNSIQDPNDQSNVNGPIHIFNLKIDEEDLANYEIIDKNRVEESTNQFTMIKAQNSAPILEETSTRDNKLEFIKDKSEKRNDEDVEVLGYFCNFHNLNDSSSAPESSGEKYQPEISVNEFESESSGTELQPESSREEYQPGSSGYEVQAKNSGASTSRGRKRKRLIGSNRLQAWERAVLNSSIKTNLGFKILYIQPVYNSIEELRGQTSFAVVGDRKGQVGYGIKYAACRTTAIRESIERAITNSFRINLILYKIKTKTRVTICNTCTGSSGGLIVTLNPSYEGLGMQNCSSFISKILKIVGIDDCSVDVKNEINYIGHVGIALCKALRKLQREEDQDNA